MIGAEEIEMLRGTGVALVAVDTQGLIVYATDSALAMLGQDKGLLGQPLVTIIPKRLRRRHLDGFRKYLQSGTSNLQGHAVRVPAVTASGAERDLDLAIRIFRRPDGTFLATAALADPKAGSDPPNLRRIETDLQKRLYQLV